MGRLLRLALDILYPRGATCALCGGEVDSSEMGVCHRCAAELPAQPVIRTDIAGLSRVHAAFSYEEPLINAIHRFKYEKQRHLARFFASRMRPLLPDADAVLMGVPLHPARRRQRGFCQTDELCAELSLTGECKWMRNAISRVRDTPSQTRLSAAERKVNLENAFAAKPTVTGKHIVLIDDVVSTGSTLRECAHALRESGAADVTAVVIAT